MNRYTVTALGDLRTHLIGIGRDTQVSIVAHDVASVWRKFQTQYFSGPLGPNPADYDITLTGKHTDAPHCPSNLDWIART